MQIVGLSRGGCRWDSKDLKTKQTNDTARAKECFREVFPSRYSAPVAVPARLKGAKILSLGSYPVKSDPKLILRYEADGKGHEIVLAFTELGMWIQSERDLCPSNLGVSSK